MFALSNCVFFGSEAPVLNNYSENNASTSSTSSTHSGRCDGSADANVCKSTTTPCATLLGGAYSGEATCTPDCQWDTAACKQNTLSAGGSHSCKLEDDKVTCWGNDSFGQSSASESIAFREIKAFGYLSCGIQTDGKINCWGDLDFEISKFKNVWSNHVFSFKVEFSVFTQS